MRFGRGQAMSRSDRRGWTDVESTITRGGVETLCALDPERDVQFVLGQWTRWITLRGCRLRLEDGDRRDAEVDVGGIYAAMADEIRMDELTKAKIDAIWKTWG